MITQLFATLLTKWPTDVSFSVSKLSTGLVSPRTSSKVTSGVRKLARTVTRTLMKSFLFTSLLVVFKTCEVNSECFSLFSQTLRQFLGQSQERSVCFLKTTKLLPVNLQTVLSFFKVKHDCAVVSKHAFVFLSCHFNKQVCWYKVKPPQFCVSVR